MKLAAVLYREKSVPAKADSPWFAWCKYQCQVVSGNMSEV